MLEFLKHLLTQWQASGANPRHIARLEALIEELELADHNR